MNSRSLRIVAAQINSMLGDIPNNALKIIDFAKRARDEFHADIVAFPEMVITGYPPADLLLRSELYQQIDTAIKLIIQQVPDVYLILGYPEMLGNQCYNTAGLFYQGRILTAYHKRQLPEYGVFDEKRYFTPGLHPCIYNIKGVNISISICEDMWFPQAIQDAKNSYAELTININASPFDMYKPFIREKTMSQRAKEGNMPLIYVNSVGGQDELVFDGGSMVLNATGEVTQRAEFFTETLLPIDIDIANKPEPVIHPILPISSIEERVYKALVLGTRDYIEKNKFKGAIVSVSGGIDSALTLAIAVDAIGKDRVETVYLPSQYSSDLSTRLAKQLVEALQVKFSIISIEPMYAAFMQALSTEFTDRPKDVTEENLQARCRAVLLMALSNKKHLLVLSTGNKSENAVGYATLYGDMAGGFCVISDVPKTLVFRLAKYRNSISPVIPEETITREPSAELAAGQKDSDSLPPYEVLDAILERYVERDLSAEKIVAEGFERATVMKVIKMIYRNEYKRRQAAPGIRITARAFGKDRRYPITSAFE